MTQKLSPIEEYALWTGAGISPDLLSQFDFGSGESPSLVSSVGHGTAETVALTQQEDDRDLLKLADLAPEQLTERGIERVATVRARWFTATQHVMIDGIPCVVDMDADYSWEGEETGYVGATKLTIYGDCPTCFHEHETQDNEWTWEPRETSANGFAVCECGNEYEIRSGKPVQFGGVK